MKRFAATLFLGILLGAIMVNVYMVKRMDQLYIDREQLRVKLYETTERLKKTEAQWQSHRVLTVREVEVQFNRQVNDKFLELALREAISRLVQNLVGEKLESISPALAINLLDRRIIEADGQRYRLRVKTLVIAQKITYILDCEQLDSRSDDEP